MVIRSSEALGRSGAGRVFGVIDALGGWPTVNFPSGH